MGVLYRLNCGVSPEESYATLYSYQILKETSNSYTIRSGSYNKRIKKENIGNIQSVDMDKTLYKVFLTDKEQLAKYLEDMLIRIKANAENKVERYNNIVKNCVKCDIKEESVESE